MHFQRIAYFLLSMLFPAANWRFKSEKAVVYLTFDDGPTIATNYVLQQLSTFKAQATFFCIGDNVRKNPEVFEKLIAAGHAVGNHTYHHKNGWKTSTLDYLQDVNKCSEIVKSGLFRPPYGRLTWKQYNALKSKYQIVMWDVLSFDFKAAITPDACIERVLRSAKPGSIIVFHDSEKCFPILKEVLPVILDSFQSKGWQMLSLPERVHD